MKKLAIILTLWPVVGCGDEPDRMQMPPPDVNGVPQQVVYGDDDICPFPNDLTFFVPDEYVATACDTSRPFNDNRINPNALVFDCRVTAMGYFYPNRGVDFCQWMLDIACDDALQGTVTNYYFNIQDAAQGPQGPLPRTVYMDVNRGSDPFDYSNSVCSAEVPLVGPGV
jgi:hypothetical protein